MLDGYIPRWKLLDAVSTSNLESFARGLTPTDLTLNGNATDVWIFKVAGTLDLAAAKSVILSGGAKAKNIFWQVSGAVTIGTTAHLEGVVLSATAITLQTGASANSRLLAQTAVTLDSNAVTQPAP
jgi:hypothetical protein